MRQIFFNGSVYTAENGKQESAFVVEGQRFLFVGNDEDALAFAQEGDNIRDMEGARIIPGMMDTHCHYLALTAMDLENRIELVETMTHEEVLATVRDIAESEEGKKLPVICGLGYGIDCITLAEELDRAVADRPVFLIDSGGHSGWMNTKMIELADIDENTPDPKPGASYFVRDEQGRPTGQTIETDATFYVQGKTSFVTVENMRAHLPEMMHTLHSFGITAAYDAGIMLLPEQDVYEALQSIDVTVQFFTSFHYNGTRAVESLLAEMIAGRDTYSSEWIHPTTLKMFMDGTIEAESAWMFDDYLPPASGRGEKMQAPDVMIEMGKAAAANSFNVHIHAIGDRAIATALDVFEDLGTIEGAKTMAHVQVLPADGVERFGACGDVFYQTTPVWLGRDVFTRDVLGEERYLRQMPLHSLLAAGVPLTFGSDAPVSGGLAGMNPFANMHAAVNRAFDQERYIPPATEGIDIASCIDAYTINGAAQVRATSEIGSIAKGKQASFAVLDQDILQIAPEAIGDTSVVETWSAGTCVYLR